MEEKVLFPGLAHILWTCSLALLLFKLKKNALNEYCINHHGSFFCFNNSTTLFHTKLFFHIICITNLLLPKRRSVTQFPLRRKFNPRNRGACITDYAPAVESWTESCAFRTIKKVFSMYFNTSTNHNLAHLYYTHTED